VSIFFARGRELALDSIWNIESPAVSENDETTRDASFTGLTTSLPGAEAVPEGVGAGQDRGQAPGQPVPDDAGAKPLQNHRTLLQGPGKIYLLIR
jgi:hypothetical protein